MFNLFKKQPSSLDKSTVKEAAEQLMARHGATTTLEVKNHLRSRNYHAFQAEVSNLMDSIAQEEGWAFQWSGRFRVYYVPQPTNLSEVLGVPAFSEN